MAAWAAWVLHQLPKLLVWGWLERSQRICIWPIWAPWYLVDLRYVSWNLLGIWFLHDGRHLWHLLVCIPAVQHTALGWLELMSSTYMDWQTCFGQTAHLGFVPYGNFKLGMLMSEAHISSTASRNGCPLNLLIAGWYVRTYIYIHIIFIYICKCPKKERTCSLFVWISEYIFVKPQLTGKLWCQFLQGEHIVHFLNVSATYGGTPTYDLEKSFGRKEWQVFRDPF